MADVLYQLPDDQVADLATITLDVGTEDTTYPLAYLTDSNIARPCKVNEVTATWKFDFGAAQRIDLVALGPHNFDAGLAVYVQGNATDAWGGPTVNAALTIPADDADDRAVCPFLDLTGVSGYTTTGFRYWRLHVSGVNSAALQLGEVWLGQTKRVMATDFGYHYQEPFEVEDLRRIITHETDYGVETVYDLMTRRRVFRGELRIGAAGVAAFWDWHRAMRGRVYPTIFIPDADVNDVWWIRQARDARVRRNTEGAQDISLVLDEVSHGLPL